MPEHPAPLGIALQLYQRARWKDTSGHQSDAVPIGNAQSRQARIPGLHQPISDISYHSYFEPTSQMRIWRGTCRKLQGLVELSRFAAELAKIVYTPCPGAKIHTACIGYSETKENCYGKDYQTE